MPPERTSSASLDEFEGQLKADSKEPTLSHLEFIS